MRKLTSRRRRWLAMRQRATLRRKRGPVAKVTLILSELGWRRVKVYRAGQPTRIMQGMPTSMPAIVSFDKNAEETLSALASIRERLHQVGSELKRSGHRRDRKNQVRYRAFETIQEISPSAALVIAAEYERAYYHTQSAPGIVSIEKWHPEVYTILDALGFFQKFGFPAPPDHKSTSKPFRILPMRSGSTADSLAVNELLQDLKTLYPLAGNVHAETDGLVHLFGAMVEAIVNVVRHAYPVNGNFAYPPVNRWWITGAVDMQARWTTAIVFDQGVTIPLSLPNWRNYGGVIQRLTSWLGIAPDPGDTKSDGLAISAAVEESVSSTGELHRGRGLAQMRDFVDGCQGGFLRIMSRCGEVVMRPGQPPNVRTHNYSLDGTLVEWNVLL